MIEALLVGTGQAGVGYRPPPAISVRAVAEGRPLPLMGAVGTGGMETGSYHLMRMGYPLLEVVPTNAALEEAPFAKLMQEVKSGFGRTMSRLPEVFGVSRQTLYNWLDGETPKDTHHAKIIQLAEASRTFSELGFKPTSSSLDRTVLHGMSLLQLLANGADGRDAAKKLVRISQRAAESKSKLDGLLGGRKMRLDASDVGTPSLNEDV